MSLKERFDPSEAQELWASFVLAAAVATTTVRFFSPVLNLGEAAHPSQVLLRFAIIALGAGMVFTTVSLNHLIEATPFRYFVPFFLLVFASPLWSPEPLIAFLEGGAFIATLAIAAMLTLSYGWEWVTTRVVAFTTLFLLASVILETANSATAFGADRWFGLAGSPTGLGQVAAVSALLALTLLVASNPSRRLGAALTGSVLLSILVVALTQSRIPLLAIFVGGAAVIILKSPSGVRGVATLFIGSATVAALVLLSKPLTSLALRDDIAVDELSNVSGRSEAWALAIDLIAEKPFLGYGFASGDDLFLNDLLVGNITWFPRHSHQLFLELLTSLGFIGLALFLVPFVMTIRAKGSTTVFIPRFLIAAMVGLGLTEPIVHEATIYAILLGVAIAAGRSPLTARHFEENLPLSSRRVFLDEEKFEPLEAA